MAATWVFKRDSILGPGFYHFQGTNLVAGANSFNPATLVGPTGNDWPAGYIPTGVIVQSVYDAAHTTPSLVQADYTTLSNTNVTVYCDASGSLTCDAFVV